MTDPHAIIAQTVRRFDPDRYFSALFAPETVRRHLMTLYAFNHETARIAETVHQPMMGQIRLEWWRETLDGARNGAPRDHNVARALAELFAAQALPIELFDAILDARAFDTSQEMFFDWAAVETYCDATSGNIMRLASRILWSDGEGDAAAREAGIAYALAGLIRALPFHAARHKVYLPQDVLDAAGLSPDTIMAGAFNVKVKAAVAQTLQKAREHFLKAQHVRIPRALLPGFLPAALVPLYLRRAGSKSFDPLKHSGDVPQYRKQIALFAAAARGRI